jgi:hypothetical protein
VSKEIGEFVVGGEANNKMAKGKKTKPNRAQKKRVPAREGAEENLKISEVTEEVLKEELSALEGTPLHNTLWSPHFISTPWAERMQYILGTSLDAVRQYAAGERFSMKKLDPKSRELFEKYMLDWRDEETFARSKQVEEHILNAHKKHDLKDAGNIAIAEVMQSSPGYNTTDFPWSDTVEKAESFEGKHQSGRRAVLHLAWKHGTIFKNFNHVPLTQCMHCSEGTDTYNFLCEDCGHCGLCQQSLKGMHGGYWYEKDAVFTCWNCTFMCRHCLLGFKFEEMAVEAWEDWELGDDGGSYDNWCCQSCFDEHGLPCD